MYAHLKDETPFADGYLDALALCLLEGPVVRHEVVCALSALEANCPCDKPVVCRSQLSEVLLAGGPRYTSVRQGLHHLGLQHAHLQSERGTLYISRLNRCNMPMRVGRVVSSLA